MDSGASSSRVCAGASGTILMPSAREKDLLELLKSCLLMARAQEGKSAVSLILLSDSTRIPGTQSAIDDVLPFQNCAICSSNVERVGAGHSAVGSYFWSATMERPKIRTESMIMSNEREERRRRKGAQLNYVNVTEDELV